MKKTFVEPKIKRIELNMKENIANSDAQEVVYVLQQKMTEMCFIQDTQFNYLDVWMHKVTEDQLMNCASYVNTYSMNRDKTRVTRKELFGY